MKASLDTNVILHLYRADKQAVLFDFFDEAIYIDEFIYDVELKNHGSDIKDKLDEDINAGKIKVITKDWLKEKRLLSLYNEYLTEQIYLYSSADKGEACAIALAKLLGAMSVVTDDIKTGGPHYTLMCLPDSDLIPFTYYELIIMLYMMNAYSAETVVETIETVKKHSPEYNFDLTSKLKKFINRTLRDPYSKRDKRWFDDFAKQNNIDILEKIKQLRSYIKQKST